MAERNSGNIAARARRLAEPIAAGLGLSLWDVRFLKEGALWYLRFWIDKPGGVDLDDCEAMSRALDQPLDDAALIEGPYHLEVCSPGIERELTREEHFAQYIGSQITVRRQGAGGRMQETLGTLEGYANKQISLRLEDGALIEIERAKTTVVRLYDAFEDTGDAFGDEEDTED
ncbi:MAG: ribosome maturation factor RimP [Oscillospiraceae bacterium]|jgi:ribosome maturation factor RimP|nr:ribosome maturation factor RimP [Oscillospiraceae bacterium]